MDEIEIVSNVGQIGESLKTSSSFNAIFWILIFINFLILAFTINQNRGYIVTLFNIGIFNRHIQGNNRDLLQFQRPSSILLNLLYFNSIAIIIWKIAGLKNQHEILIILAILIGLALFKLLIIQAITRISQQPEGLLEHAINHVIFFQIGGIVLSIILLFTHYLPTSYQSVINLLLISVALILIGIRELHSFNRAYQAHVSIFYIILYLCTLEILPLLVLLRIFILV